MPRVKREVQPTATQQDMLRPLVTRNRAAMATSLAPTLSKASSTPIAAHTSFAEASPASRTPVKRRKTTSVAPPTPQSPSQASIARRAKYTKPSAPSTSPDLLHIQLPFHLPDAIAHLSSTDARFARMFEHLPCRPFVPPLTAIDPFRTLVTSIIGQQVSWMAAKAITTRFRAFFGYDGEEGFPTAERVAKSETMALKGVGLSLRKAEYGELSSTASESNDVCQFGEKPRYGLGAYSQSSRLHSTSCPVHCRPNFCAMEPTRIYQKPS